MHLNRCALWWRGSNLSIHIYTCNASANFTKIHITYLCELYDLLTRRNGYCFAIPSMSVATTKLNWFYVVLLNSAECECSYKIMYTSDSHCVYFTLESALICNKDNLT